MNEATELWEKFAVENAEYYILSHGKINFSTKEGQNYFFESGQKDTGLLLVNVQDYIKKKEKALEIGCGIGRLVFAHATKFKEVNGVDVSKTMLNRLRALAALKNINNVNTFLSSEHWDKEDYYDYIYSFIVFQHIVSFDIIKDYIRRISKSIHHSGIIQLHFDTRDISLAYLVREVIPDFLLPRPYKKGIRRIRRDADNLRLYFEANNLEIIKELHPNTSNHIFIMKRA